MPPIAFLRFAVTVSMALAWLGSGPGFAQDAQLPAGYATRPFTPGDFHLPEGQGCSAEVARWQAIQDNDYRTGNIGLGVYRQIQTEIARAAAACSAGHDAQASAMVASSKARHGYR